MSDFSALQTALSGLTAHQKALQTAGHNAANAATPGFSRQRVDMKAVGGGVGRRHRQCFFWGRISGHEHLILMLP